MTGPEVLIVVRRIEARGAVETAYRALKPAGAVFRHGVQSGLCESDPTRDLKGSVVLPVSKHRAAIIDPAKLGELLRAIENYRGTPVVRAALTLAPMVFLRPNEFRRAEWPEIDLDDATWSIPSARMKGKTKGQAQRRAPHRPACSPGRSGTAAVATVDWEWPIRVSPPAHRGASYVGQRDSDGPSTHGLRQGGSHRSRVQGATARTILAEQLDVPSELIEAQLAHAVGDALGRAYNRTKFLEQRRRMMVTVPSTSKNCATEVRPHRGMHHPMPAAGWDLPRHGGIQQRARRGLKVPVIPTRI